MFQIRRLKISALETLLPDKHFLSYQYEANTGIQLHNRPHQLSEKHCVFQSYRIQLIKHNLIKQTKGWNKAKIQIRDWEEPKALCKTSIEYAVKIMSSDTSGYICPVSFSAERDLL